MPDTSASGRQQVARIRGRFAPGVSGNPGGRPVGSRNRINADFLRELADHFALEGRNAIERMCAEDPAAYIKVVASLLPKDVTISAQPFAEFTDDELKAAIDTIERYMDSGAPPLALAIEGEVRTLPDERS